MLPCWWKNLTGIDCPGCGIQRSVWALVRGDIVESIKLYPALFPLAFTFVLIFLNRVYQHTQIEKLLRISYISSVIIILCNFLLKLIL